MPAHQTKHETRESVTINGMKPASGFTPRNLSVLIDKGRSYVCAFEGSVGGRDFFHIRELYEEYGELRPGKGVAVPLEKKAEFLGALSLYIKGTGNASPKK
jgi:hypothetical protein